jgi:hypothetical protein
LAAFKFGDSGKGKTRSKADKAKPLWLSFDKNQNLQIDAKTRDEARLIAANIANVRFWG